MDHITRNLDSPLAHIRVPYICSQLPPCSVVSYFQWMQNADAWFGESRRDPFETFAAKIQSYLYFGLLSAFLGVSVAHDSILQTDSRDLKTIDSCWVSRMLLEWRELPASCPAGTREFLSLETEEAFSGWKAACRGYGECAAESGPECTGEHMKGCSAARNAYLDVRARDAHEILERTWEIVNKHVLDYLRRSEYGPEADLWTEPAYSVIFAVDVLMDQLGASVPNTEEVSTFGSRDLRRCNLVVGFPPFLNSIHRSGRCPSLAWRLQLPSTDYYRLLFLPDHSPKRNHSLCTYRKCCQFDVLHTRHREPCTGCSVVKSDLETVMTCIAEGGTPLIHCRYDQQGRLHTDTVRGSLLSHYTAVSHVWAGGLGNMMANELPQCQIRYLLHTISELSTPTGFNFYEDDLGELPNFNNVTGLFSRRNEALFWIDTLCIPTSGKLDVSSNLRRRIELSKITAINSMAQLYAGAAKVMVIDPELQHLPSEVVDNDHASLASYISISPWMARCWPLQEGALPQNLYFRLKDRSVFLRDTDYQRAGLPSMRMVEYYKEHQYTTAVPQPPQTGASRFSTLWNSLVSRSTMQPADLPAILAAMVDCSAEEVLGLPMERRMKALTRSQATLPVAIFYQPNCIESSCWIPSVPGSDPQQLFIHDHFGSLHVTERGFLLRKVADTSAIILDSDADCDHFVLVVRGNGVDETRYLISHETNRELEGQQQSTQSLFLLSKISAVGVARYHGARFKITRRNSEGLVIQFVAAVLWNHASETDAGLPETAYTSCSLLHDIGKQDFEVVVDVGMCFSLRRR
jgi:hypothetical protein